MARNKQPIILKDNNRHHEDIMDGGESTNTYNLSSEHPIVSKFKGIHISQLCNTHGSLLSFPSDVIGKDEDPVLFDVKPSTRYDGCLRFRTDNLMGFVGVTDSKGKSKYLTVRSRFEEGDRNFFLQYLLTRVFGFNVFKDLDFTRDPKVQAFDWLMMMFPHYLKKAYAQGLFRAYKTFKHNDAKVRGAIDAPRHLRKNTPFQGRIAYNTREYTRDNPLMQLIRHTIECVDRHKTGKEILKSDYETREIIGVIRQYTLYSPNNKLQVISQNLRPVVHPFYTAYADLQDICLKILRHERIGYGNKKETVYGMLFDGAWLWEEYLNTILCDQGFTHPQNKERVGGIQLFSVESSKQHTLYPDFYNESDKVVLDAKYKSFDNRLNNSTWDSGIREDIFQIITYMHIQGYEKGGFIYPDITEQTIKEYPLSDGRGTVYTIPFRVPKGYDDWNWKKYCDAMHEEESKMKRRIHDLHL